LGTQKGDSLRRIGGTEVNPRESFWLFQYVFGSSSACLRSFERLPIKVGNTCRIVYHAALRDQQEVFCAAARHSDVAGILGGKYNRQPRNGSYRKGAGVKKWIPHLSLAVSVAALVLVIVALHVAGAPGEVAVQRREKALIEHYYPKFRAILKDAGAYREKPETLEDLFDPFVDLMGQLTRVGL